MDMQVDSGQAMTRQIRNLQDIRGKMGEAKEIYEDSMYEYHAVYKTYRRERDKSPENLVKTFIVRLISTLTCSLA